jgi:hypothetical protein
MYQELLALWTGELGAETYRRISTEQQRRSRTAPEPKTGQSEIGLTTGDTTNFDECMKLAPFTTQN